MVGTPDSSSAPAASLPKSTSAKNGERSPSAIAFFWSLFRYGASNGSWNRNAASKNALAQVSPYTASQNHILDDVTFGNGEEDIDAVAPGNLNPNEGVGNQDDHL